MMADLLMKCAHCGKELLGDVYRVDQARLAISLLATFLRNLSFGDASAISAL